MAVTEYVYKNRDNPVVLTVKSSNSTTPLNGVTRMTVELIEARLTFDSDLVATDITWTDTTFTLSLNDKLVSGSQRAIVVAYDPAHPDGQVISHPDGPSESRLTLLFLMG